VGTRSLFLVWLGVFAIVDGVSAGTALDPVVALHYAVRENDPDRLQKVVTVPIEQAMRMLERVQQISSSTSHGTVDMEIGFFGKATKEDLAAVNAQIETIRLGDDVNIISRKIELRPPRLPFNSIKENR